MRLAIVFQRVDPTQGGAETYVADLCRFLVHENHQVDLIAAEVNADALPPGVVWHKTPVDGFTRLSRIWSFAKNSEQILLDLEGTVDCSIGMINTWGQDILIPQGGVHPASRDHNARRYPPGPSRWAYLGGKRLNPRSWVYWLIERRQFDLTRGTRYVAVSDFVRGHLNRYYGVPDERVTVIPNAIDADRLTVADPARARACFRDEQGLAADDLVGLFVGHNFKLKGLAPLLRALHARTREGAPGQRPIHLAVCGGGRIAPFRREVQRLGLDRVVRLIGYYREIPWAFHGCDFFVSPTYYDPCSLVVFEALACGLPVITTVCNGAGELITQGREGFVIPRPDDLPALVAALDAMTDDGRRREMSEHGRKLGQAQSFEAHARRLLELARSVASERVARSGDRLKTGHGPHPPSRFQETQIARPVSRFEPHGEETSR